MCRPSSHTPITQLLLNDLETTHCADSDVVAHMYSIALGFDSETEATKKKLYGRLLWLRHVLRGFFTGR